jgi:hypothetical protein
MEFLWNPRCVAAAASRLGGMKKALATLFHQRRKCHRILPLVGNTQQHPGSTQPVQPRLAARGQPDSGGARRGRCRYACPASPAQRRFRNPSPWQSPPWLRSAWRRTARARGSPGSVRTPVRSGPGPPGARRYGASARGCVRWQGYRCRRPASQRFAATFPGRNRARARRGSAPRCGARSSPGKALRHRGRRAVEVAGRNSQERRTRQPAAGAFPAQAKIRIHTIAGAGIERPDHCRHRG